MRYGVLIGILALVPCQALAQQREAPTAAAPAQSTAAVTAPDIAKIVAGMPRTPDQAMQVRRLLNNGAYNVNLEHRTGTAGASVHPDAAELFYVIDGTATLVTGGALAKDANGASVIEGGVARQVATGDIIMVPENTAHWFSVVPDQVTLMSLHLPRIAQDK